ncbi:MULTISPECIES: Cof-type HAD-IIB family hydrolase [Microbacterium]|jgi:Cof subfamily protein (haloacid dehalogenase superfamily)|uniref:Cof-type HAD-IIB family hydrolase n=1 Tax=Microbacterium TaxID=33882 RepID=UPI001D178754|nr:Cof-type HAD-IIB family hydrolase [Microbacterium testaceum]MCC4247602.1 Cof-type HAD-IIB family hydrolase [Microbacterium testaceum]
MTRIAFLDVDGTILEHGSVIAPSTVTAIRQARANGHLVWLCTGRAEGDIHPEVKAIGFDGAISNGGAYASRDGELLVQHPMRRDDVAAMEEYFDVHGIQYFLQTHEAVFASPGIEPVMREYVRERLTRRAAEIAALGLDIEPTTSIPRARPLSEVDRDRVAKAVFISPALDTVAHAAVELGERFHVIPGSIPLPGGSNGEIGLSGVTKGSAIVEVLELLGIDAADAIGIGDSWNDVEMFQVVGTPVAMGNAVPELQRLAGRVTTAVLDDGVHNAFTELGLI